MITLQDVDAVITPYKSQPMLSPGDASNLSYKLIELLMEGSCEREVLRALSSLFSTDTYEQLVQERVINHHCGYPLCGVVDPQKIYHKVQKNPLVAKLKLPGAYKTSYCTQQHYQGSEFYKKQLSPEAIWARTDVVNLDVNPKDQYYTFLLEDVLDNSDRVPRNSMDTLQQSLDELRLSVTQQSGVDHNDIKIKEHDASEL
ncbi:unnamed protein product [Kuraishia capsulata CBS 1993]|uniref:RNA polymerase II subunit B1 CTD phosphatase RPAP2 homolog n=1 Tax=Kuraishia capsulata CBS 1993 TaxID=1382522 RepID=W6MS07_9ASCO|nr:uncharacterized protein KUCA_T00005165001 [Kuraishia capsulata CBS 1993]CDK29178.1 unnamed protein product [Kuraishia capsulata CBS 1993]